MDIFGIDVYLLCRVRGEAESTWKEGAGVIRGAPMRSSPRRLPLSCPRSLCAKATTDRSYNYSLSRPPGLCGILTMAGYILIGIFFSVLAALVLSAILSGIWSVVTYWTTFVPFLPLPSFALSFPADSRCNARSSHCVHILVPQASTLLIILHFSLLLGELSIH